jgi:hypothetical protein
MSRKLALLGLALAVHGWLPSASHAGYLSAVSCKISVLEQQFHFTGNTGNVNLQNVETVYLELDSCNAKQSSGGATHFAVTFDRFYPDFGTVKAAGAIPYPEGVVLRWTDTLRSLKLNHGRVSIFGEGLDNLISSPITVEIR